MSNELLAAKVGLITGAASGIGRATAQLFARYGAKVLLTDVNVEAGQAAAQEIRDAGGTAEFQVADVSITADVEAMVTRVVETWGRLDFAVNNAGIDGGLGPLVECSDENFDRVIAVNLRGVFSCMRAELRQMLGQGSGSIVNISSVAGLVGFPGVGAYSAAKHGVVGLTRTAALECGKSGVRVNAICPGVIRTPMLDDAIQQGFMSEEQMLGMQPIGRMGTPEEVGEAAAWMCSDKSKFMLGHALALDGGMVAG